MNLNYGLNPEQQKIHDECVDWFRNSSSQVFEISGPAGSGKTYLISAILRTLGLQPQSFLAMAYTGQASIVMRSRGFTEARSIHSSLYETVELPLDEVDLRFGIRKKRTVFQKREFIDPNIRLFFIDEAYMVPEYMVKDIKSFGIKIIACGDSNQLPPVGDNPGFLVNYGVHRLTTIMRQSQNNPIIYLSDRAIKGLPIHSGNYGNKALVINDDEFIPEMINYADVIGCGTNRTRDLINAWVRQMAGFSHSQIPIIGERVICRNNNWDLVSNGIALTNGLSGVVTSFPNASSFDNQVFHINFKPDLSNCMFYDVPLNFEYFTGSFERKQELKEFSNRKYLQGELFEFAYALSVWLMQGSEYANGIYVEEFMRPQIQKQLNYTAVTRFKNSFIWVKKKNKNLYLPNLNQIFNG